MVINWLLIALSAVLLNLVPNGGFENGFQDWNALWTREENVGYARIDRENVHTGRSAIRIEHTGEEDWSLTPYQRIDVSGGELFSLTCWIKVQGEGNAELCAITYQPGDRVSEWTYAGKRVHETDGWSHIQSRFIVPNGISQIHPRLIGYGKATVWMDDFELVREGHVSDYQSKLPDDLAISNELIGVEFKPEESLLNITDQRNGVVHRQVPYMQGGMVKQATAADNAIEWTWLHFPTNSDIDFTLELDAEHAEFCLQIQADTDLNAPIAFPHPFVNQAGDYLVVPMNEGISYPVDDSSINPMRLIAYGGHGICMPFWGVTNGEGGRMAIMETPNDDSLRIIRNDGLLAALPEWEDEKGKFGYERSIRYIFFEQGGHVAMCKRYREYARQTGLLKTLKSKREENPNVDRLVGAVNVWCWEHNAVELVREMQSLGIDRILWSHRESPDEIRSMNRMEGVLTSRYDIYQDVMNPDNFKHLRGVHPDWTTEAWPDDLMIDASGDWRRGWRVKGKDEQWYPCGVLCDRQALSYARERISNELKNHPYRSRFIDTTTASSWRECYHPEHPMTRTESRYWKMQLLRVVSDEMGLVTGSETGHDAAVPYLHYFEGMLSLGPYRIPDAGRNMRELWYDVPERVEKFQLGHEYRLPLWELVYHDCVVAQWYWGDYNNKLPTLWDKRNLFNILYGTPPMFMFDDEVWEQYKERFVESYKKVAPVVRKVGYAEMMDHRFLREDRSVQQTRFDNGVIVTVNFGKAPYMLDEETVVAPMDFAVYDSDLKQGCDYMMHE